MRKTVSDIGNMLIFSTEMMKSLYSLIATEEDYDRHVNEKTRLSLYADFLYPLAEDSTLEAFYQEKPEGEFCQELTEASAALNLYAVVHGEEQADLSAWKAAPKKSLCSGFNDADPDAIIAWNRRMADLVTMDEIAKAIRNKIPAAKLRKMKSLTKIQNR